MASHEVCESVRARRLAQWQTEYESALRETDHMTLFKRVEVAEATLLNCRDSLEQTTDPIQRTEIEAALAKLHVIKKEVLNFDLESRP